MPQRLFSTGKIGTFLDDFGPGKEKRRGETVTIINATFRVQPFDAKLASAIDDGLSDNSGVRAALFKLNNPEPKPHIERLNFNLSCPRQQLIIYASPDTDTSRVAFDQVKISGVYARTQRDMDGYAFVFKATFGPVGRTELELLQSWFQTQRFLTFEEAEPSLDLDDDDEGADENAAPPRPKPMWDDEPDQLVETTGLTDTQAAAKTKDVREKAHRYPTKAKKAKKGRK